MGDIVYGEVGKLLIRLVFVRGLLYFWRWEILDDGFDVCVIGEVWFF